MKYNLLLILFFAFLLRGYAQITLTLTPETVTTYVNPDSFEVIGKAVLKNTSTTAKKFSWTRTIKSITTDWASLVCDKNACWQASVSTAPSTVDLAAGATSNLDVYIRPAKKGGTASVEVKVFELGNESNTITGKYNFSTTTKVRDLKDNGVAIRMYPNPTVDFFQLTDNDAIDKVVIYNIIGRQMRVYKAQDDMKYNVSDLPDGLYIIRVLNSSGATMKTMRLSKSRPRA